MPDEGGSSVNTLYCSFCGKSQHDVKKLIAGPTVFICDECVLLCMDIIIDDEKFTLKDALTELFTLMDTRPARRARRAESERIQKEALDPPTRLTAELGSSTTPP